MSSKKSIEDKKENQDIEVTQFYEPVQLQDRDNMVEFSDEEDPMGSLQNSPMTNDFSEKEKKRKDINEYFDDVEFHRKRKITEELLKLKREATLKKKLRRNLTKNLSMEDGATDGNATFRAEKKIQIKQVNVAKLPNLYRDDVGHLVSKEYTKVNKAQEKKIAKKAKLMYNTEGERPSSAKSGQT